MRGCPLLFLVKTALILVALTLTVESWSRFQAARGEMETGALYANTKQQRPVSETAYTRAIKSLDQSIQMNPASSLYYAQTADIQLRIASRLTVEGKSGSAAAQFFGSRVSAIEGLARGPSDPYAWFVLAYSVQALDGFSEQTLSALNMSFATGMTEGALLIPRISMCFGYWPQLPETLKETTKWQIELALRNNNLRRRLAHYAESLAPVPQADFLRIVEEVGFELPEDMKNFQYWMRVSSRERRAQELVRSRIGS